MPVIRKLPLFPLDMVLYPHQNLQIFVGEERHRVVAERCIERKEAFGIVYAHEGKVAQIGSLAWIRHVVSRNDDGTISLFVNGGDRFRILHAYPSDTYLTADVETILEPDEQPSSVVKERAITQHMRLLELTGQRVRPSIYQNRADVSFVLAVGSGLTDEEKQRVLEMESENERIGFLMIHFEAVLPKVQEMEAARRKVRSNGHFKEETRGGESTGE